jgi:hypothetical protein
MVYGKMQQGILCLLAQKSSNVPFLPSRNVPCDWQRALGVGHSFVVATSKRSPGKDPERVSDLLNMSVRELSRAEVLQ